MVTVEKPCHWESLSVWIAEKDGASSAPAHTSLALHGLWPSSDGGFPLPARLPLSKRLCQNRRIIFFANCEEVTAKEFIRSEYRAGLSRAMAGQGQRQAAVGRANSTGGLISRLQLSPEFVQKTQIRATFDKHVWNRFDEPRFVEPQRMKPQGVLRICLTPSTVRQRF